MLVGFTIIIYNTREFRYCVTYDFFK